MIVAVTGHRPHKLWGYDIHKEPRYKKLHNNMIEFLEQNQATHCISGMALGVDTVFAIASLHYRDKYPERNIIVECAIPCRNHSSKWNSKDQDLYNRILNKSDVVTLVSDEEYKPYLMQKRNEYMVNKCNLLLAIWDGTSGGTGNCVKYAEKKNKEIFIIKPIEIK